MLNSPLYTTPQSGDMWADARACGNPANAVASMNHRPQAAVFGGSYGTGAPIDGVTTKRPEGLGGRAG